MKTVAVRVFGALLILSLGCASGWSQATAQINGAVKDQSGAVLPGVEITATQIDTAVARTAITNETGAYILPNLPVGPYRVEAALPGFRTFVQTGIVLQVNSNPVVNAVLEVGQVTEQVEVQANAALVETRASGVGQIMENTRILELPLNGRNVVELIGLTGATTPGASTSSVGIPWNNTYYSVSGGLVQSVAFTLDGATHNNAANNLEFPMPFPDALQEFKVETGALGAQSGMHASGSVNSVTKSGTNQVHGDAFEFVRNGMFNARNFFASKRDSLKRNQFGGTLGGPIVKNRLFFFGGYQGTVIRQDPSDTTGFVPTAAMLAGDFTAFASPACNVGRQITLRAPFVNNQADPSTFSPAAVKFSKQLPTTADPCGRILYGGRNIENDHQAIGRIDYQRSSNQTIFGRYLVTSQHVPPPYSLSSNLLTAVTIGNDSLAQTFTAGDTYLFGANIVNSFRFSGNRSATTRLPAEYFSAPDIGIKQFSYVPKCLAVQVTGGPTVNCGLGPGFVNVGTFAINDDVSWIRGNHQLAFGGAAAYTQYNFLASFFAYGRYTFNGQTTGLGMADFLTGRLSNLQMAPPDGQVAHHKYFGLYSQDTWKASSRVTLSYGVRWEPFLPQERTDNGATAFDPDAFRKGVQTTVFTNAPPGLFYPGDPGFPGNTGMYKRWANFSPRIGVAWDPSGDGRTSIRASYAFSYDFPAIQFHLNTAIAPPWRPKVQLLSGSFDDPWRDYPGGSPFPFVVNKDVTYPPSSIYAAMRYDTKNPTISQWNLNVQRQIGDNFMFSASYIGNVSAHLWLVKELNPAQFLGLGPCTLNGVSYPTCSTTANTDQRRVFSLENPQTGRFFSSLNFVDDGGTANYHGLLLSFQRRASRGVAFNGNYTWSHCISDPYSYRTPGGAGGYSDPTNRRADRGNCTTSATDRRHAFNLSTVIDTPQFSNSTLRAIATGWRLSPIVRIQSGGYFSVTTTSDIALNGLTAQRVNQVLPDVYGDKSVSNYLNPRAFALPAAGTRGNLGIAPFTGPAYWQFDTSLSRTFRVKETQRIELRAEAFNVTNSLRKNNPVTNFNAGNFGQITSALDPRIMQFALKYIF